MAYYKTDVEVKIYRDNPDAPGARKPVTIKVDLPSREVSAETSEGAKYRALEIVTSLLNPSLVGLHTEATANAYFDFV